MPRAVILIGVKKTGRLQPLHAVSEGVRVMKEWARGQNIADANIITITDDAGPVTARLIKNAVKKIADQGTCEQLIIYFAGHGVNIRYGEYWLLSGAPEDTQEAVNVEGSVVLARQCGISHVVFISDACRTAPEGLQAQFVTGSEIFPNEGSSGTELPVDLFFACSLGKPALEIKDPVLTAGSYRAVYTDALVEALEGKGPSVLLESGTDNARYVRPRPLKRYLRTEVARILSTAQVPLGTNQTPDARITSDETAWLSRFQGASSLAPTGGAFPPPAATTVPPPPPRSVTETNRIPIEAGTFSLHQFSRDLLEEALTSATPTLTASPPAQQTAPPRGQGRSVVYEAVNLDSLLPADESETAMLLGSAQRTAEDFGPTHFESGCGFKVRGLRLMEAFTLSGSAQILDHEQTLVRIENNMLSATVALRFKNDTGAVLPAIAGFVAALTFEDEELVNVTYEPTDNSSRYQLVQTRIPKLRQLRAIIAASARLGVFRLEGKDVLELAREMQLSKGVDPTMALYAAYVYADLREDNAINTMQDYMRNDLGFTLFDVALLARALDKTKPAERANVLPSFPLLSQGWALLSAYNVALPDTLVSLRRHLMPSLWTLFDSTGMDMVIAAMKTGEIN